MSRSNHPAQHPRFSRRLALQAGSIGLLGLASDHLAALRNAQAAPAGGAGRAKSVIYIFLSGGLGQHDSFDMKPDAPDMIRGEFQPIATATPGLQICEHLPLLAQRSRLWSLVRSLTHTQNGHLEAHMIMLSGRTPLPPGFKKRDPQPTDWPAIAAVAGAATRPRNNLPPAVILPDKLIQNDARNVVPGQFGGVLGRNRDPWFIEASAYDSASYGAYPEFGFDHQERPQQSHTREFRSPELVLPEGFASSRLHGRIDLLKAIDVQRRDLERTAVAQQFDRYRQGAVSLLADENVRNAFDVVHAPPQVLDRYGRNSFGWSLLMARRLVEAGVNLVQVNLGNNETWDTHGNAFPHLKNNLFPPTDKAVSALLDDLQDSGLLDSTMIVMAGEFGRTPKITSLPPEYKLPGRDHWGACQSVFFAGGGVPGGVVVGSSDKIGAYPVASPQTAENMAATIYHSLGIPETTMLTDDLARPHHVYYGEPIKGLT
ncbi:MAG: DUF1501 domain-containing protein [Planctomycetales bacterium]|nr:DUF1501 domain-containing protein [Planctomycetales bacterium]